MANPLISAKTSESPPTVLLHPLVLLTASDLITRHRLRDLQGPVVGLLLGQNRGTEITAEHAFTAKVKDGVLDQTDDWTAKRIVQYKDVHKSPALEVVGWFTLCAEDGPRSEHAMLHKQLTTLYVENGILLAIHPQAFESASAASGKLPISIYEAVVENDHPADEGKMQIDGAEGLNFKFRPIPYQIETDESEMIAINYVAKGAGSAAAVSDTSKSASATKKEQNESKSKGKTSSQPTPASAEKIQTLTADEEDQIAGMTTRLNSVKMLQSRIQMMSKLIESMPSSYIADQTIPLTEQSPNPEYLAHLRNIQALLTRLSLLTPTDPRESQVLQTASQSQANDVALSSLLSILGQDIQGLSELGRKFTTVEQGKSVKSKGKGGFNQNVYGGLDEHDGRPSGLATMMM